MTLAVYRPDIVDIHVSGHALCLVAWFGWVSWLCAVLYVGWLRALLDNLVGSDLLGWFAWFSWLVGWLGRID